MPNTTITSNPVSASVEPHTHYSINSDKSNKALTDSSAYITKVGVIPEWHYYTLTQSSKIPTLGKTNSAGGGSTGTMSVTTQLGKGTAIDIKPRHYLVKKWQRLT